MPSREQAFSSVSRERDETSAARRRWAMGVDLGGQSVKLAVVDEDGTAALRRQTAVDATRSASDITSLLTDQIRGLLAEAAAGGLSVSGVGVVMPGHMDRDRTRLEFAANLPTLGGSNLLAELKRAVPLPVEFDADSNAAAWGEYRFGAGRGVDRLIVAAVGTGIGAGVIIDGRILRIRNHTAGSLGHITVDAHGPRCACGGRGCVEALASGPALERRAAELAQHCPGSRLADLLAQEGRLTGAHIGLALHEDDPTAHQAVRECGWWLGVAVAVWSAVFAPHKVLVGGGVSALGEPWVAAIREGFREAGPPALTRQVVIERAALGADAGLLGAAALALG